MDTKYLRGQHLAWKWRRTDGQRTASGDQQPACDAVQRPPEYWISLGRAIHGLCGLRHRSSYRQLTDRHEDARCVLREIHPDAHGT